MEEYRASKKSLAALVDRIEDVHRRMKDDDDSDRHLKTYWKAIASKPTKGRNPDDIRRLFTLFETIRTRPLENLDVWDEEKRRAKDALHSYLSIYRAIEVNRRIKSA